MEKVVLDLNLALDCIILDRLIHAGQHLSAVKIQLGCITGKEEARLEGFESESGETRSLLLHTSAGSNPAKFTTRPTPKSTEHRWRPHIDISAPTGKQEKNPDVNQVVLM